MTFHDWWCDESGQHRPGDDLAQDTSEYKLAEDAYYAGVEAMRAERDLELHKVLTCGVAASHPDAGLSRRSPYGDKWDSPQAQEVRKLRADFEEEQARCRELVAECRSLQQKLGTAEAERDSIAALLPARAWFASVPLPDRVRMYLEHKDQLREVFRQHVAEVLDRLQVQLRDDESGTFSEIARRSFRQACESLGHAMIELKLTAASPSGSPLLFPLTPELLDAATLAYSQATGWPGATVERAKQINPEQWERSHRGIEAAVNIIISLCFTKQ